MTRCGGLGLFFLAVTGVVKWFNISGPKRGLTDPRRLFVLCEKGPMAESVSSWAEEKLCSMQKDVGISASWADWLSPALATAFVLAWF